MKRIGRGGLIDRKWFLDQDHSALLVEEDRVDRNIGKIGIEDPGGDGAEVVTVLPAFAAEQPTLFVGLTLERGGWRTQERTHLLAAHARLDLVESGSSLWLAAGKQQHT